ncbi:MAG: hypothetical protein Q8S71_11980 [Hydrogenophaga sp.]|jgi:hypothetical protein|nr:hypothetical protein [Hydrogenophaga sp.]
MNEYRELLALLPQDPELQGEVTAVDATTGTLLVALPGGGVQRVRGTASVGGHVFFQSGRVTGEAPDRAFITIEE